MRTAIGFFYDIVAYLTMREFEDVLSHVYCCVINEIHFINKGDY